MNKEQVQLLKFELREAILDKFMGVKPLYTKFNSGIDLEQVEQSGRVYERELSRIAGKWRVYYKSRVLAELTKKPHKSVIMYEQFDEYRLASKLLENTILTYVPAVKLEWRTGE